MQQARLLSRIIQQNIMDQQYLCENYLWCHAIKICIFNTSLLRSRTTHLPYAVDCVGKLFLKV